MRTPTASGRQHRDPRRPRAGMFPERGVLPCAFVLLAAATPATAALAAKRVALMPADGDSDASAEGPVRAKITKALKQHKLQVAAPAQVKKALKKGGAPSADDEWVNLARKLKVDAFISVTASQKGAKRRAEIVVRNGADGATAGQATFAAKGPAKRLAAAVGGGFWKKLGPAFTKTSAPAKADRGGGLAARDLPPPESSPLGGGKTATSGDDEKTTAAASDSTAAAPEDKKAATRDDDGKAATGSGAKDNAKDNAVTADDDGEKAATAGDQGEAGADANNSGAGDRSSALRALEVELDLRMLRRGFNYVPVLAEPYYFLDFVPLIGASAGWYPIQYAGLFLHAEFTNLLKTGIYPTATREIVIGAQGRFPIAMAQIGGSVAFFQHLFVIADTPAANDVPRSSLPTPDTSYTGARIAVNGRLRLGDRVLVGLEGAYRLVTNPGQGTNLIRSPDYFPNASVSVAFDGAVFVAVGLLPFLEVRAGADYRRYVFGTLQGTSSNATGATDSYSAFSLGVVGAFGGK